MNIGERFDLIKEVGEEVVTEEELKDLLDEKEHPLAYDGFEPSGLAHVAFGVYRATNLKKMIKAGVRFNLLLADWYAWINEKMGGDLEKIRKVGEYFQEVWKAAGVPMDKVNVIWASELMDRDYWKTVLEVAKNHTLSRTQRALTIAGREAAGENPTAMVFYPSMQAADIFEMDVDICQLGMDQRKANMLARDVAEKIGRKKPVTVSHHILMGLSSEDGKMSKSVPSSAIYVHDTKDEIMRKMKDAYCPMEDVKNNPVLDYTEHIIFQNFESITVERKDKYGGDVTYESYGEVVDEYRKGELHPLDLKKTVARYLDELVQPIRKHFLEDEDARELYDFVKEQKITR